ncbi:MAG: hypothetical protein WAU91_15635 [Desulfatitalea sp.]
MAVLLLMPAFSAQAQAVEIILQATGAVVRAADLGLSPRQVAFAYRNARWIRNRYTVLDLAAELGKLEEWGTEVLGAV